MIPVLVGCAHGTRSAAGRSAADALRAAIAAARPGLEVRAAHVDVHGPWLDDVVEELRDAGRRFVVVPLLLSSGYHVRVDVARAVEKAGGLGVAAAALGPDPSLAALLQERLAEAAAAPGDAVVLAAAGSSDPRATADVERAAELLAELRGVPVRPAYLATAAPTVADAVAAARSGGAAVAIATYLLAPGLFADKLAAVGADRVTAPLAPHPALAALALSRYDAALA